MKACQDKWDALIGEIRANLNADPADFVARDLARRRQALFNEACGGHPGLGRKIDRACGGHGKGAMISVDRCLSSRRSRISSRTP